MLDRYFGAIARSFGDRVGCALSGGYDLRLILAFLRRHGLKPRVYVYGRAGEKDVLLASQIARREGFSLDVIDKDDRPIIPPDQFAETARLNFLAADSYQYTGIFQNGAEIAESARRVCGNTIAFNGGGGEIFRNFFYLPDGKYTIRELLWSFYSQFDPAVCTPVFDSTRYYNALENKVMDLLASDERRLPRPTVEWLYHSFRCRAWDGKVDSVVARYGFTAMPYLERSITEHASALRLSWKNHGAYEAELIRRADRGLSAVPSNYGHDFSGPPPAVAALGRLCNLPSAALAAALHLSAQICSASVRRLAGLSRRAISKRGAARRGRSAEPIVSARPDRRRGPIRQSSVSGIRAAPLWRAC